MQDPKHISVGAVRTRYYEAGQGDPVVLVHGGHYGMLPNAHDWSTNFDDLARDFRVLALDKLGMGHTDNPPDEAFLMQDTVRHLTEFLRVLDLERVHLVGHSRGGYAVTRLALEHPELARSVTIVSSSTLVAPPNPIYARWEQESRSLSDPRERVRYLINANSMTGQHITEGYIDALREVEELPKTQIAAGKMAEGLYDRFVAELMTDQAETQRWIRSGRLRCPVHVVWGYQDPSARVDTCAVPAMDLLFPSVDQVEMTILQAGHYTFRECPETFNERARSFLARH